jgi:hypothetical protein
MEIARAALREIFPSAPEDGLDEGARHLARWGVEGHGTQLDSSTAALMYIDLAWSAQEEQVPDNVIEAAEVRETARTWRAPSRRRQGPAF